MIQLNVSGNYVTLVVNGSSQEELHKDTDAIEFSRYQDGKVSLVFGRRSFYLETATNFEINGSAVTDADDFITKLRAVFSTYVSGATGSFTTVDGKTVTVVKGRITTIV